MPQIKIFFVFLRHGKKEHYNHRTRSACIRRLRIQAAASRYLRDRWRRGLSSEVHPPDQYYTRQGPGQQRTLLGIRHACHHRKRAHHEGGFRESLHRLHSPHDAGRTGTGILLCTGKKNISLRGTAPMLIHYIDKYGAQPYDSYEDPKHVNYKVLCRKVQKLCDGAILKKAGISQLKEELNDLFDAEIGYMPAKAVHMLGAEYTPQEFAHSVCYPEEYVSLTSFSHHPYREYFALEIPDNRMHDAYLNLPLDELMLHIRKAVEKGHPVCWEGDISEPGFKEPRKNCVDIQPMERPVTQASRQKEFEQLRTTDDHVMEIIGIFMKGKQRFYVCRNSWGKNWGNKGLIYLSEDYLRLKTIAVFMSEEAYIIRYKLPNRLQT